MTFVFSVWFIIAAILLVGVVACMVVFFKMDKKDRQILDKFVKEQTEQANQGETEKYQESNN